MPLPFEKDIEKVLLVGLEYLTPLCCSFYSWW